MKLNFLRIFLVRDRLWTFADILSIVVEIECRPLSNGLFFNHSDQQSISYSIAFNVNETLGAVISKRVEAL